MNKYFSDLISVIVPVYNAEKYLLDTMHSIINQTYKNIEIIVIDDASNDNSFNIVKQINDSRIRIVRLQYNDGVANARNVGIKNSKGEYIAFIDSDDLWENNKLERQIQYLNKNKGDLCFSGYTLINSNGTLIKRINIPSKTDYHKLLSTNVIACSTVLIKKSFLLDHQFRKIKHEDYVMWLELAKSNIHMIGLNESLMKYRKHNHSISSNKIQSATWVWNIYRNVEKLSITKSIFYFFKYTISGLKKHYTL